MEPSHVVVIGASAGGVSALLELAAALPAGFPAAVGIVLHVGSQPSILPELLSRSGPLPALHPADGQALLPATLYVAPPDHHLLFTPRRIQLSRGPRENHARPAVDPLFRSAALGWRERVIGVVLTGSLDDGTAGLAAIKECGGTAIVQDPATASEPGMPASALAHVAVDLCLPLQAIGPALQQRVSRLPEPANPASDRLRREHAVFEGKDPVNHLAAVATPSSFTCPDCGGSLWELKETRPLRYRCHTGHAFTAGSLQSTQAQMAEHALWRSVRALREREMLLRRLALVSRATGDEPQAAAGLRTAERLHAQSEALVRVVEAEAGTA